VEVILEIHERGCQALRKDLTILILCSQIPQTYGGEFKERMLVLRVIEPQPSSTMANHVIDRAIPARQS
jgi:hypothetical protein